MKIVENLKQKIETLKKKLTEKKRRWLNFMTKANFINLSVLSLSLIIPYYSYAASNNSYDHWQHTLSGQIHIFNSKKEEYIKESKQGIKIFDYIIGVDSALQKVFKNKLWFRGKFIDQVDLTCAKNEYEGFQICILPLTNKDINNVSIGLADLKGEKTGDILSKRNISLRLVDYVFAVDAKYPTPYSGLWPDPLVEMRQFNVLSKETQPVWDVRNSSPILPVLYGDMKAAVVQVINLR